MAKTPGNLKYAKSDEWFDEGTGRMGISDYAQEQLSDIVFLEVTVEVGGLVQAGSVIASVESVKAASDVLAPVTGKVAEINHALLEAPENINEDPYGSWFIRFEQSSADELLHAEAYAVYCESRG